MILNFIWLKLSLVINLNLLVIFVTIVVGRRLVSFLFIDRSDLHFLDDLWGYILNWGWDVCGEGRIII